MANTGSISATVIDIRNNQPLADATINLSGPKTETTKTGEDGKFKFSDLQPSNDYSMTASKSGYEMGKYQDIPVLDGIDTDLQNLSLYPDYG